VTGWESWVGAVTGVAAWGIPAACSRLSKRGTIEKQNRAFVGMDSARFVGMDIRSGAKPLKSFERVKGIEP
jgi:hypothetical protein